MTKRNYESPQMEVASIENMQIICGSYEGNPATMEWGDDNGGNWAVKSNDEGLSIEW